MAKNPIDLSNQIINDEETIDQFHKRLGHYPSENEYKEWISPRIKKTYDEYVKQGLDRKNIRSELTDAYYYPDLINEVMGGSEDDDWFAEMKTKTKFPQGIFVPEINDWDKLHERLSFLDPADKYAVLKVVASRFGDRYQNGGE